MATQDPIEHILGHGSLLADALGPSFEVRPAQLAMARRVAATLEEGARLAVEAGTGTGKTLAYLAPAVLSDHKVVISTATRTLQEQIFARDIPLLLAGLGLQLQVACMKGIGNYLCRRRFAEVRGSGQQDLLDPDPHLLLIEPWAETTLSGDRAELATLPDDSPVWPRVSPTPESRLGARCPHYEECFVTRMRREAAAARLVVVNHHLLLADLAVRSQFPEACVIPPYDALILDEAHGLESIATRFFGRSASLDQLSALARDAVREAELTDDASGGALARRIEEQAAELFHLLARQLPRAGGPAGGGRVRLNHEPLTGELQRPYFTLDAGLEALQAHLELRADEHGREQAAHLGDRAAAQRETLALFAERPARGYIFWAEQRRRGPALHASPVEVGPILQSTLLADPVPLVFTSATLATSAPGSSRPRDDAQPPAAPPSPLSYFRGRVGLTGPEQEALTEELVLRSPFDFERQALLYVPRDLPLPGAAEFVPRAAERIAQLVDMTRGRALVLFTSYRNLQAARELLAPRLSYPLLHQGSAPRTLLLQRFRSQVSSVLLATASFWEGVDVPGEALSMVVMDKLPFAVPDEPLTAARIERIEERGESAFLSYQVPQAVLALKQGFGRLIRHRDDRGVVAILDRRLAERPYGRAMLEALPPCPRTGDLLRVRAFCKQLLDGRAASGS